MACFEVPASLYANSNFGLVGFWFLIFPSLSRRQVVDLASYPQCCNVLASCLVAVMLGKNSRHAYNPSTLKTVYPEFQHLVWAERKRRQTADKVHATKHKEAQEGSAASVSLPI